MTESPPVDVAVQRRRLIVMLLINVICLILAAGALIGFVTFHIAWLGAVLILALLVGFAAHFWLALGLSRKR
ncbi:MAG: hypothetical protein P4L64_18780 [Caulobacteraceae bacterium]|nr:hypothetical protein [Caulobacteraceae bacterium]